MALKTSLILAAISIVATAALSAKRFVTVAGAVPAAGDWCPGVANASCAVGESASVATHGIEFVESGAAVAAGAAVQTDASGRAIALGAGASLGRAMDAATGAGELIRVKLS